MYSTYTPGVFTPSNLLRFRAIFTVIPNLANPTFAPSIQPNLGIPLIRPPLISAINILLATYPNHLNTLWSTILLNSISILVLLSTFSFLSLSIRDTPTKLLEHFISRTFTFLLSALLIPHVTAQYTTPLGIQLLIHIDTYFNLSPLPYWSAHFSQLPYFIPHIHSVNHITFTSSIRCHLRLLVLKIIHFLCFPLLYFLSLFVSQVLLGCGESYLETILFIPLGPVLLILIVIIIKIHHLVSHTFSTPISIPRAPHNIKL